MDNKPVLKDIFNLTVVINSLKTQYNNSYNFEVSDTQLETNIHIWNKVNKFDLETQQRYIKFNNDVKALLDDMIKELEAKRDNLTLQTLTIGIPETAYLYVKDIEGFAVMKSKNELEPGDMVITKEEYDKIVGG